MKDDSLLSRKKFQEYCGGIPRSTLRYYDSKGILKPVFTDDNGYQYYDVSQIYTYFHISMLRTLDCSVDEIKKILFEPNVMYCDILKEKRVNIDNKIESLMRIRDTSDAIQKLLDLCSDGCFGIPHLMNVDMSLNYYCNRTEENREFDLLHFLEKRVDTRRIVENDTRFLLYPMGVLVDRNSFLNGHNEYYGYMLGVREDRLFDKTAKTESGEMVICYYLSERPLSELEYLDRVREYIQDNNLNALSDLYTSIVPYSIKEDAIVEYLNVLYIKVGNK